jgi:nitrate/TMAO reductase-like tetraheme cytochrome c subunit
MGNFAQRWVLPVLYFTDNWISRSGLFLILTAMVLWIFLTGASAASGYLGILQFVALPATFFLGLLLVPIGISIQRRKESPDHKLHLPEKIELSNPKVRQLLLFVGGATFVNLVVGGALSFQTVHYMESTNFCGTACHVMEPEHLAYQAGSHAQVKCVACHIGEGAGNAIRAKLNGTRQLFLVMSGGYSRPIPSPPHALKPASETCENCHSRNHDYGNRLWRRTQFNDAGEKLDTALLLKLGGAEGKGIHGAHMGRGLSIEYEAADRKREKILALKVRRGGETTEYASDAYRSGQAKVELTRQMDCLDCHNRPAHEFNVPDRAVDRLMAEGIMPSSVPFLRKASLEVLNLPYSSRAVAASEIPAKLAAFYQKTQPALLSSHQADLNKAGRELNALYQRNVFPEMKIGWGTYPQHLGHTDSPGCFRCHGEELKSKTPGKAITQDCESCHKVLGVEEKDMKAIQELGG